MVTSAGISTDVAVATAVVSIAAGAVRLPDGADIGSPRVDGTDLLFVQPDGTVILVPDGAVTAFTLFVGETEIPPDVVVPLLEVAAIDTAAGPAPDSGAHGQFSSLGLQSVGQGAGDRPGLLDDSTDRTPSPPVTLVVVDAPISPMSPDRLPSAPVNSPANIGGVATGAVTEDRLPAEDETFSGTNELDWGQNAFITWGGPSGEFLTEYGREPGTQSVLKTFDTGDAGRLILSFDLFQIDAWEDETFLIFLGNAVAFDVQPFAWPATSAGSFALVGGITGTYVITASGVEGDVLGDPGIDDRIYHVELTLDGAGDTLTLGFGTTLDEDFSDEDFGVDNIRIASTELRADGVLTITDADLGEAAFQPVSVAGDNGYGSFVLDAAGHWAYRADNSDPRIQALGAGEAVTDSFTAWSLDGSASQVVTVTIHGTNDAPQLVAGGIAAFVEDAGPVEVAPDLGLSDIDSPMLAGATITVTGFNPSDRLAWSAVDGVTASYEAATGRLDFSGAAGLATYQALLRSITFSSTSDTPSRSDRVVNISVSDGSATSNIAAVTVTVTPTNDAPSASIPGAQTVAEDGALVFSVANGNLLRVTDPEFDRLTVTVSVTHGTLTRAAGETGATLVLEGLASEVSTWLRDLKYVPDRDYSGPDTLTIVTSDPSASTTNTIDISVTAVADQPILTVEQLVTTPIPTGDPVQLNATTGGLQNLPDVAALPGGGYVAVWQGEDIYLRRFAADGTPVGGEVPVNIVTANTQSTAQVAVLDDGRIVVSWQSYGQDGSAFGIFARLFTADGTPAGAEFQVNSSTQYNQQTPSVAPLADGGYVFTWSSTDGNTYCIYTQRFGADGMPLGGETVVASGTLDQTDPTIIALAGGGYAVAWTDGWSGMTATITSFRIFDEGGVAGPVIQVNGGDHADIAALADGGYAVVSEVYNSDGSGDGIAVRVYNADGSPRTNTEVVNTTTAGHQEQPTVIGLPDGGFLVAWDGGALATQGIYLQRYDASGARVGTELRLSADGYAPQLAVLTSGEVVVTWQGGGEIHAQTIQASNATGTENQPFELPLVIALDDANGTPAEVLSSLHISGLPDGFSLAVGGLNDEGAWVVDRSTTAGAAWLDTIAAGGAVIVAPAAGYHGTVTVSVTATSLEPLNGSTASSTALVSVTVAPDPMSHFALLDTDPGIDVPALADTSIVYRVENLDALDLIADYDFGNGDRIDLSDLLDGVSPDNIVDFIRFEDGVLSVDTDGAGPADFVEAVAFPEPPATATLVFDNGFETVVTNN